jgi:hypothetical protein
MICSRHDEQDQPEPQRNGHFDAARRIGYQLGRSSWAAWHDLNIHKVDNKELSRSCDKYYFYNVIVLVP